MVIRILATDVVLAHPWSLGKSLLEPLFLVKSLGYPECLDQEAYLRQSLKIREHRGGLTESMATVETIEGTKGAVLEFLERRFGIRELEVQPYGKDPRTGWNLHAVMITTGPHQGIHGWTDGPVS